MTAMFKRIWILLLAGLLLAGLVAGAYAASTNNDKVKKEKGCETIEGKNWQAKEGVIKPNGMPTPRKNLRDKANPSADKEMIEKRPRPLEEAPVNLTGDGEGSE